MKLDELGYNSSIRDKVFERIWEIIGNNFMIKIVPVENKEGNVTKQHHRFEVVDDLTIDYTKK